MANTDDVKRGGRRDPLKRENQKLNRNIYFQYIKGSSFIEIAKKLGILIKDVRRVICRTAAKATLREIVESIVAKIYKENGNVFQDIVEAGTKKILEFIKTSEPLTTWEEVDKLTDIVERINEIIQRDVTKTAQSMMVYPALPAYEVQKLISHVASDPVFNADKATNVTIKTNT